MVDEKSEALTAPGEAPDLGWHPVGAVPSAPGWYPTGTNPNEQAYWDGQHWTARRHWSVNGWVEVGVATGATSLADVRPRLSANPYVPPAFSKPRTKPATMSVGILLIMACGIALMFGSVGTWVHVTGSVGGVAALPRVGQRHRSAGSRPSSGSTGTSPSSAASCCSCSAGWP